MGVTWFSDPIDITPSGFSSGVWTDLDVTTHLASGESGVILHIYNNSGTDRRVGVRKNGSTDELNSASGGDIESNSHMWVGVGIDGSDIFEFVSEDTTGTMEFYLVGSTDSDFVWLTNGVDFTPGSLSTWTDADISGTTTGTALMGIFHVGQDSTSIATIGARMNGSTDARLQTVEAWCHVWVGLDGSEIAEFNVSSSSSKVVLVGYCTANVTMNTNANDRSLGSTGSPIDLTALPSGATGGIYETHSTGTTYTYGFRENGGETGWVVNKASKRKSWAVVKCDASQLIEGQISNTGMDFYEIGYFTAATEDVLTANDVATGTPTLDSAAIGQEHVIAANDMLSGTPLLDTPILGQVHALSANDLISSTPELDSPVFSEENSLSADDLSTAQPIIAQSSIGQAHVILADDLATGVSLLDSASLGQEHSIVADDLATNSPILSTPVLAEAGHSLSADDLATSAPLLTAPVLGQIHALIGDDLSTSQPTLSSPVVSEGSHALTADDLIVGVPTLSTVAIGEIHALTSDDLITGVVLIDSPVLGQTHVITANGIDTLSPILDNGALGQAHTIQGNDLLSGVPTLTSAAIDANIPTQSVVITSNSNGATIISKGQSSIIKTPEMASIK